MRFKYYLLYIFTFFIFLVILITSFGNKENKSLNQISVDVDKEPIKKDLIILKNDPRTLKINSFFNKKYKNRVFNGNILFAEKGQIITSNSYGYSNFRNKEKLTKNHSFQLASVSKPFTAIAILQLIEKGEIYLNDSLQKFFPNFPYKKITIHQLLSHRSGMSKYTHFCYAPDSIWPDKNLTINNKDVI